MAKKNAYEASVDQYYANAGKPGGMSLKGGKSKSSWTGFSTKGWGPGTYIGVGAFFYYFTGQDGLGWHQGGSLNYLRGGS